MKRIKNILLLLIIFVLSGCSVKYTVSINNDLSVNEKVEATEYTNRMMALTGFDESQSVYYLYDMFNRGGEKSNLSTKNDGNEKIATVTLNHDSLEDFKDSFSSDITEGISIEEEDDLVTIMITQDTKLTDYGDNTPLYDNIEVVFDVPFDVKDHNADEVNFNKYKWIIEKEDTPRTIRITFDKKNYRDQQKISIGNISFNLSYQVIAIGVIGLVILVIAIVVFIKNKKNNKV